MHICFFNQTRGREDLAELATPGRLVVWHVNSLAPTERKSASRFFFCERPFSRLRKKREDYRGYISGQVHREGDKGLKEVRIGDPSGMP